MAPLVSVVCVFGQLWWRATVPLSSLQLPTLQRPQPPEQDLQHPGVPRWVRGSCKKPVAMVSRVFWIIRSMCNLVDGISFSDCLWVYWICVSSLTSCCRSEVGCPPGRLYRECERGEGCPFSCAQVSGREGCYSDGCEEGCHCPLHTYQHHGVCLQVGSL